MSKTRTSHSNTPENWTFQFNHHTRQRWSPQLGKLTSYTIWRLGYWYPDDPRLLGEVVLQGFKEMA